MAQRQSSWSDEIAFLRAQLPERNETLWNDYHSKYGDEEISRTTFINVLKGARRVWANHLWVVRSYLLERIDGLQGGGGSADSGGVHMTRFPQTPTSDITRAA